MIVFLLLPLVPLLDRAAALRSTREGGVATTIVIPEPPLSQETVTE